MTQQPSLSLAIRFMIFGCVFLALPLGLHWWVLQAGNAVTALGRRLARWRKGIVREQRR